MLAQTDETNEEMKKLDADIAAIDRDIEGRERRLSMVRQYRERLWDRRATLQNQLARANAPLVKPQGHCVRVDGWDV